MAVMLTRGQEAGRHAMPAPRPRRTRRSRRRSGSRITCWSIRWRSEIGVGLIRLADPKRGGDLLERITRVRQNVAAEIGIIMPKVRIRDNIRLDQNQYRIKIADMPVADGVVYPDMLLAMDSGLTTGRIDGIPTKDPAFGTPAVWIEPANRNQAEMMGYTVVEPASVLATHLSEVVRRHADEILTRDATKHLIDELKKTSPAVVDELIPGLMKLAEVQQILQMLLREQVPIRQLGPILETLGDYAGAHQGPGAADRVRAASPGARRSAPAIATRRTACTWSTLDPALEDRIRAGIEHTRARAVHPHVAASGRGDLPGRSARRSRSSCAANHPPVRAGQPADSRGAEADHRAAPAAVGGAELQRNHAGHADRVAGDGGGCGGQRRSCCIAKPQAESTRTQPLAFAKRNSQCNSHRSKARHGSQNVSSQVDAGSPGAGAPRAGARARPCCTRAKSAAAGCWAGFRGRRQDRGHGVDGRLRAEPVAAGR